jgi:hypothetical protein
MKPDEEVNEETANSTDANLQSVVGEIVRSIKSVRFGSVEITIHNSRVVQIERKEKVRFDSPPRARIG